MGFEATFSDNEILGLMQNAPGGVEGVAGDGVVGYHRIG